MDGEHLDDREILSSLRRVAGSSEALVEPELPAGDAALARYRIVGRIGAGGMGIVYEAEQSAPRRKVALKVLRAGIASRRELRRFEYEAEILARLDHPRIAKVLEAGSFDTGQGPRPWFAMELVRGEQLSAHVARQNPDRRARLELFVQICEAVHHAHQKGIIHRDLKPGNILIDAAGGPKVLDFGVARAVERDAGSTVRTLAGQLVGTLPYMSPEQLSGDPDAVDVRSDVYALGVVLYELLAGRLPIDAAGQPFAAAVRAIESSDAPRLGTLVPALRGDLEVIAAKALEKERERRYDSAAALAEDVLRHLRHEPITARPPSGIYQLGRFARRNRVLVGGVAAVFVALVVGIVSTRVQALRAARAEGDARVALERSRADARRAHIAAQFLQSVLEQADPAMTVGDDPSMRDVLELAAHRAGAELAGEPVVEAQVRTSLGRAYLGLDDLAAGRENLERALALVEEMFGPDDPDVAGVLAGLAQLAFFEGHHDAAAEHVARVRRIDAVHPVPRGVLAACALTLGRAHYLASCFAQAEPEIERAIELYATSETGEEAPDSADLGGAKRSLALVREALGDKQGATTLLRESVAILSRVAGARNPQTANTLDLLGSNLLRRGEVREAEQALREALEIRRARFGEDHTATALSLRNLGLLMLAKGELDAAEETLVDSVERLRRADGEEHPYTTQGMVLVAQVIAERGGRADEVEMIAREVLALTLERTGADDPVAATALRFLGGALAESGRADEAYAALRADFDMSARLYPPGHDQRVASALAFARLLTESKRFEEAEAVLLPAYELAAAERPGFALTSQLRLAAAGLYEAWGKADEARRFRQP